MGKLRGLLVVLGLAALTVLGVACAAADAPGGPSASDNNSAGTGGLGLLAGNPGSVQASSGLAGPEKSANNYVAGFALAENGQVSGIWVTGVGRETVRPDLATISLGVEARASTVAEAMTQANQAMNKIMEALRARGIPENDIQTQYFNIQPQYSYRDVETCDPAPMPPDGTSKPMPEQCYRHGEQVLTGYIVTNQVSVKVRDFSILGQLIDEVAAAGGDATRVNGISFSVEDTTAAANKAREEAVKDAIAKADQFASLTGVNRGRLMYIAESGGYYPQPYMLRGIAEGAVPAKDGSVTPISSGEFEITVSVQAVFAIE